MKFNLVKRCWHNGKEKVLFSGDSKELILSEYQRHSNRDFGSFCVIDEYIDGVFIHRELIFSAIKEAQNGK